MDFPDFSLLQRAPGLRDEILAEHWKDLFGPRLLARAVALTDSDRLQSCRAIKDGEDDIVVEGHFRGNQHRTFFTQVFFIYDRPTREYEFDTECSCEDYFLCEHAAALLLHLIDLFKTSPQPASASDLDAETRDWLDVLEVTQHPPTRSAQEKPDNRFLAYCIEPPAHRLSLPELHLHVGRRLKSGEIRIDRGSHANADPFNPPKYLRSDDLLPCTLIRQHLSRRNPYSGFSLRTYPLEGEPAHAVLTESLKTGRLFYLPDFNEPVPVQAAAAIPVTPTWRHESDGSATPSLDLPPEAVLIPTSPLFALVPPSGREQCEAALHPLECATLSDSLLATWHQGPTVPAAALAQLTGHLSKFAEPLPAPPAVQRKTLPKVRPVPKLDLYRENPFVHGGLHLSGQPEPIIAELSFLYHGHTAPFPPSYQRTLSALTVSEDQTVLSIPRHKTAELELIQTLRDTLGVVAADEVDPVPPKNLGRFLPNSPPRDWDLEWARIIAHDLPVLEEQGWQISIDTSARIELHPIGPDNLDTGLTELPDHGIDWFQFDPGYLTPAGERQSLLPLLCAYLETINPEFIPESLADLPEDDQTILKDPGTGQFVSIGTRRLLTLVKSIYDLFGYASPDQPLHRIQAADLADSLDLDHSETHRALAELGRNLKSVTTLPKRRPPKNLTATLRDYQLDGYQWLQFLARHSLHGILADDMGLGKTLQALAHLQAEVNGRRTNKRPSLVVAPTSVVGNWAAEARKFAPRLRVLVLHGPDRKDHFDLISKHHLVLTTYALLNRDFEELSRHAFHLLILDEAQHIKNPASKVSRLACQLSAAHRLALSGTPLENHLGELWSQMRFLMPGLLGTGEQFRRTFRTPIEKHHDPDAQVLLNRRVAPLILRRTKEQVASELPPKTTIVHTVPLNDKQVDLYETVRAAMDKRVRDAIAEKGLARSHIIVLDALLKLRQICCHPGLLKTAAAARAGPSAKFEFLTTDLLPTLLDEGRKVLLFSSFTSMLALIEQYLQRERIPFAKIIGSTTKRQAQIDRFQNGEVPLFLISLKAGGTGLNLTAADTVIHYDPWWNPAAENQATDRAHRIGQDKPVFVHKLIAEGTIEQRIQTLQSQKAALVEALLTDDTNRLRIDQQTLNNLLAPLE